MFAGVSLFALTVRNRSFATVKIFSADRFAGLVFGKILVAKVAGSFIQASPKANKAPKLAQVAAVPIKINELHHRLTPGTYNQATISPIQVNIWLIWMFREEFLSFRGGRAILYVRHLF